MKKEILQKHIQYYDKFYDEKEHLLYYKTGYNPAHSNIIYEYAHPIYQSLKYALNLLEYENKYSKKAEDIIKKTLTLQQMNPSKDFYGLWPVFLEEGIEEMPNPDKNTAVFGLISLLDIFSKHKSILPQNTLQSIKSSCFAATTFIINRNTTLRYTHIIVQECYACVFCGEFFSRLEFVNYGLQKLERFLNFTLFSGDFFEFNSPHYSLLTAEYLKRISDNIKNTRVLEIARKLNKTLWRSLSAHYHPVTGQLAGPFSRCSTDFLSDYSKILLSTATQKNIPPLKKIPENITLPNNVSCPPQFYPFFTGEKSVKYSQRLIFHGQTCPDFAYAYAATTYSHPEYTIGTFNRSEFWHSSRPLIGYFGTEESPYCVKVICLLNGDAFASSLLHCVQVENSVLGAINFSTNRGTNYLNPKKELNEKISISDLRIRFTVLGKTNKLKTKQTNKKLHIEYNNLNINFNYNFYKSDIFTPYVELSETEDNINFDLVLYNGKKRIFNLAQSECTICQFTMMLTEYNENCTSVKNKLSHGILTSVQKYKDYEMCLKTQVKPQDWVYLMMNDCQMINGIKIEDYARDTEESALQYEFIVNSDSEIPIDISANSDMPVDNILTKIENITSLDFDSIPAECSEILGIIRDSEISLDIAKRFAIRIITNIFEVAKSYSIIFENIIKYEYSNIYINLSQDNSIDAIEKTIISILDKIKLDYRLYSENKKRKDFIDSVTAIINSDFGNPSLSLTYLAEKIGMDEAHISKTFHKRTGMTYLQYLTRVRMEHAKKLISGGESDSERIARECGYENVSSFLRAFKKHTGNTLGTFKKQNQ